MNITFKQISLLILILFFIIPGCRLSLGIGSNDDETEPPANDIPLPPLYPVTNASDGWTDLTTLLVACSSRSTGTAAVWNDTRDPGSKLAYFDPENGDNSAAELYWWDGSNIVDSNGNTQNGNGEVYGTNPLDPNTDAIAPFAYPAGIRGNSDTFDIRLRTHSYDFNAVAAGYPDWFLFRRGIEHTGFDGFLFGGQSIDHPMVVAAYGPEEDGRAVMNPRVSEVPIGNETRPSVPSPFTSTLDGENQDRVHMFYSGLEFRSDYQEDGDASFGIVGLSEINDSSNGEPTSMFFEDCKFVNVTIGAVARRIDMFRSVSAFRWSAAHNQGFFTDGYTSEARFEEMIFYKNGYKQDPLGYADPRRDIFSRNIYQGGGARMGMTYTNIISADGASGGPQMRLGGLIENSLVLEGYWFSSVNSNNMYNPWLTAEGQGQQSTLVRNNVQLVFSFPSAFDPDSNTGDDRSDVAAQPGDGYMLSSASFGAEIYNNIISGAMLNDNLGVSNSGRAGIILHTNPEVYQDGNTYSQYNNIIHDNIIYNKGSGLSIEGNWSEAEAVVVENNVFAAPGNASISGTNLTSDTQLEIRNNRFYSADSDLPNSPAIGSGNTWAAQNLAAANEGWSDPDRTLLRYVTEVLNLTVLDWSDDPTLPESQITPRSNSGEAYDPTGLKTFMAVATNMRRGGKSGIPPSGKPSWMGDYAWDERFTAEAIVNWIRAGFNLGEVPASVAD